MTTELKKRYNKLEDKIKKKKDELNKLESEHFELGITIRRTKEITVPVSKEEPLFTEILFGNEVIQLSIDSGWIVSEVEYTNPHDGEKYKRYRTVIEADPTQSYGFKQGHSSITKIDNCSSSCSYEWICFETNKPLILESRVYLNSDCSEDECYGEEELVNTEPIMMFGTLVQEGFKPWDNYYFPKIKLYKKRIWKDFGIGAKTRTKIKC